MRLFVAQIKPYDSVSKPDTVGLDRFGTWKYKSNENNTFFYIVDTVLLCFIWGSNELLLLCF